MSCIIWHVIVIYRNIKSYLLFLSFAFSLVGSKQKVSLWIYFFLNAACKDHSDFLVISFQSYHDMTEDKIDKKQKLKRNDILLSISSLIIKYRNEETTSQWLFCQEAKHFILIFRSCHFNIQQSGGGWLTRLSV